MKAIANIKDFKAYAKEQEQKAWNDYKQATKWHEEALKDDDKARIRDWHRIKTNLSGRWQVWNEVLESLGEA